MLMIRTPLQIITKRRGFPFFTSSRWPTESASRAIRLLLTKRDLQALAGQLPAVENGKLRTARSSEVARTGIISTARFFHHCLAAALIGGGRSGLTLSLTGWVESPTTLG